MKILFLAFNIFFLFMLMGCMESHEVPANTELRAEASIQHNRNEAKKAQEEYLRLQEKRSH